MIKNIKEQRKQDFLKSKFKNLQVNPLTSYEKSEDNYLSDSVKNIKKDKVNPMPLISIKNLIRDMKTDLNNKNRQNLQDRDKSIITARSIEESEDDTIEYIKEFENKFGTFLKKFKLKNY